MEGKFFHVRGEYRWKDKSRLLHRTITKAEECSWAIIEAGTEEEAWGKYVSQKEDRVDIYLRWGSAHTPSEVRFVQICNRDCDTFSVEEALKILSGEQFAKWAKRQGIIPTFQMITKELA